jgi:hypothetical protein
MPKRLVVIADGLPKGFHSQRFDPARFDTTGAILTKFDRLAMASTRRDRGIASTHFSEQREASSARRPFSMPSRIAE